MKKTISFSAAAATHVYVGGTDVVSGSSVTYWVNDECNYFKRSEMYGKN